MSARERRADRRIPLVAQVRLTFAAAGGLRAHDARTANVSPSGTLVIAGENVAVGETVELEISISPGQAGQGQAIDIHTRGQVTRVRKLSGQRDASRQYEIAIKFASPLQLTV